MRDSLARQAVDSLRAVRRNFGRGCAGRKLSLLAECARAPIASARSVRDYHDLLLFMAAHPDDERVASAVERELERVAAAAARLAATVRGAAALRGSGIFGTEIDACFTLDAASFVAGRFGRAVRILWDDGDAGEGLAELLARCASNVEADGLIGSGVGAEEWVLRAMGSAGSPSPCLSPRGGERGGLSDLAWVLKQLERLGAPPAALDRIFDSLELWIRWALAEREASTTFLRFPRRPIHFERSARRPTLDLRRLVETPLPRPKRLAAKEAESLIDIARTALALRGRETDPLTWANPGEVALFALEGGVDVAIFGMLPERRLPIESFFGYVLARNRVPVAYGGGWVFCERAEIGINVFDAFRAGGASAHLFAQMMRVYAQWFGARRFHVDGYQIGDDNEEAIRSGAFWFYYRLGFRPAVRELAALARAEWLARRTDPSHRTTAATLRRLARGNLELDLGGAAGERAPSLSAVALAITDSIAARFAGDRDRAERAARAHVSRALGVTDVRRWPRAERLAFDRLSMLPARIPDLARWPAADRRTLVALMRAKGGVREREYVVRLARHARFRAALAEMGEMGSKWGRVSFSFPVYPGERARGENETRPHFPPVHSGERARGENETRPHFPETRPHFP